MIIFDANKEPVKVGDRVVMLKGDIKACIGKVWYIGKFSGDRRGVRARIHDCPTDDITSRTDWTFASWAKGSEFAKVRGNP